MDTPFLVPFFFCVSEFFLWDLCKYANNPSTRSILSTPVLCDWLLLPAVRCDTAMIITRVGSIELARSLVVSSTHTHGRESILLYFFPAIGRDLFIYFKYIFSISISLSLACASSHQIYLRLIELASFDLPRAPIAFS